MYKERRININQNSYEMNGKKFTTTSFVKKKVILKQNKMMEKDLRS